MSDSTLTEVYTLMVTQHGCSVDDILEMPEFRTEFLRESRRVLGDLPETRAPSSNLLLAEAKNVAPLK